VYIKTHTYPLLVFLFFLVDIFMCTLKLILILYRSMSYKWLVTCMRRPVDKPAGVGHALELITKAVYFETFFLFLIILIERFLEIFFV